MEKFTFKVKVKTTIRASQMTSVCLHADILHIRWLAIILQMKWHSIVCKQTSCKQNKSFFLNCPFFFFSSKLCLNAFNYKVWTTSINSVYFILCVIGKFWEYIVRNSAWQVDCIRALYMYLMNVFPHVLSVWATLLQCVIVFDLFPNTCTSLFMFWLRKLAYFSLVYICLWFLFQVSF